MPGSVQPVIPRMSLQGAQSAQSVQSVQSAQSGTQQAPSDLLLGPEGGQPLHGLKCC